MKTHQKFSDFRCTSVEKIKKKWYDQLRNSGDHHIVRKQDWGDELQKLNRKGDRTKSNVGEMLMPTDWRASRNRDARRSRISWEINRRYNFVPVDRTKKKGKEQLLRDLHRQLLFSQTQTVLDQTVNFPTLKPVKKCRASLDLRGKNVQQFNQRNRLFSLTFQWLAKKIKKSPSGWISFAQGTKIAPNPRRLRFSWLRPYTVRTLLPQETLIFSSTACHRWIPLIRNQIESAVWWD